MKVMLNPTLGMTTSYRGVSNSVKPSAENLNKTARNGLSNEEIYSAIMKVKTKITDIFSSEGKPRSIDMLA